MCGLAREWIGQNASFGERSQIIKREFLSGPKRTALTCGFESLVWSPVFSSLVSRKDLGRYEGTSEIKGKKKKALCKKQQKIFTVAVWRCTNGPFEEQTPTRYAAAGRQVGIPLYLLMCRMEVVGWLAGGRLCWIGGGAGATEGETK